MGGVTFGSFFELPLGNEAKPGHQHNREHLPLSGHANSFVDVVAGTVEREHDGKPLPFSVSGGSIVAR